MSSTPPPPPPLVCTTDDPANQELLDDMGGYKFHLVEDVWEEVGFSSLKEAKRVLGLK
jgi:hypothetical protein